MRSAILLGAIFIGCSILATHSTPVNDIDTTMLGIVLGFYLAWDVYESFFKK